MHKAEVTRRALSKSTEQWLPSLVSLISLAQCSGCHSCKCLIWLWRSRIKLRVCYARPECLPKREKKQCLCRERKGFRKPFMGFETLHRPSCIVEKQVVHKPIFAFSLQVILRTPPNTAKADLGFGDGSCPTLKAAVLRAER